MAKENENEEKEEPKKKEKSAIEDAISEMLKDSPDLGNKDKPRKIVARIPITDEMKPKIREFRNPMAKLHKEFCRLSAIRKKFWAEVELESEHYDKHMKINAKEGVIEVYEGPITDDDDFEDEI